MSPELAALFFQRAEITGRADEWRAVNTVLGADRKTRNATGAWSSEWLPKATLEPDDEYSLRVQLTPFFPNTPEVLSGRQGLLHQHQPAAPAWDATLDGRSLMTYAEELSAAAQIYGIVASYVDRRPDGTPYVAMFRGSQIWDWSTSTDGAMDYVKLVETRIQRTEWSMPAKHLRIFYIVMRNTTTVVTVDETDAALPVIVHRDEITHNLNRVPVSFMQPFPASDGVGRSLLIQNADADLAATRTLSEITWNLWLLGNPILTYKTNKNDDELAAFVARASRYQALRAGRPGIEPAEELKFVQLDGTGLELMFRAYEMMTARSKNVDNNAQGQPVEASGVAIGWKFHTGEERILLLLARALEASLNEILDLAGFTTRIKWPTDFQPKTTGVTTTDSA